MLYKPFFGPLDEAFCTACAPSKRQGPLDISDRDVPVFVDPAEILGEAHALTGLLKRRAPHYKDASALSLKVSYGDPDMPVQKLTVLDFRQHLPRLDGFLFKVGWEENPPCVIPEDGRSQRYPPVPD